MSFGGMILTNHGRNEIAKAETGEIFNITTLCFGDGYYNGSFMQKSELTNPIMNLPVSHVYRDNDKVIIECDFNSKDAPQAFYLREIGIIANDKLCYYDNAQNDAEYIDPDSEVYMKQRRMRFILLISSEVNVTIKINSNLYALKDDLEQQKENLFNHQMDSTLHVFQSERVAWNGMLQNAKDYSDVTYQQATGYTDQKIADLIGGAPTTLDTLKEIADAISSNESVVEALDSAIGTKANDTDYQNHKSNATIHITASERTSWTNKADKNHGNHISGTTATSGRFLKSTATSGTTAWGSVGKEDITGALGYTPVNPKNALILDSYVNESNSYAQTKCVTIVFPYNGSISPAYPSSLIRLTCMHNTTVLSDAGMYILHSVSVDSSPKWDKIGGEDVTITSKGVAFKDGLCTFKFEIVVRQHGFLFIEHGGTTEVTIANSF